MTEDQNSKRSFWTTLPGILTGCAAVITAAATLIGALYAAGIISQQGSSPTPTRPSVQTTPVTESAPSEGALRIQRVIVEPPSVSSSEKATLYVTIADDEGRVVEGATVLLESGGRKFLESASATYDPNSRLHGPFSVSGQTASNGVYTTWWVCNPCAAEYVIDIEVSKEGYTDAVGELTVNVH